MQTGGGALGRGRSPTVAPPPTGLSSSSASASPSSSSSAVSAPRHIGFESLRQQQQQLALKQSLKQQQQLLQPRKLEQENLLNYKLGAMHGVIGGSSFPSSSGVPASKVPRNLPPNYARQLHEKKPSGHALDQPQNSIHQPYAQFAMQSAQQQQKALNNISVQQGEFRMMGPPAGTEEIMQELMHVKAGNRAQPPRFTNSADHVGCDEKRNEHNHIYNGQKNELKVPQTATEQFTPTNMVRPIQLMQSQGSMGNITSQQLMMAQLQAMQTWAMEHNVDLKNPSNANLVAQFLPILQSSSLATMQKPNGSSILAQKSSLSTFKPQVITSTVANENSAQGNSMNNVSSQAGLARSGVATIPVNSKSIHMQQPQAVQISVTQNDDVVTGGSSGSVLFLPQDSTSSSQSFDLSNGKKLVATDLAQMRSFRKSQDIGLPTPPSALPSNGVAGIHVLAQGGSEQATKQQIGFTEQQLLVLKAQILAFRRIKRGENALPPELLQSIVPSPLDSHSQVALLSPKMTKQENFTGQEPEEHRRHPENNNVPQPASLSKGHILPRKLPVGEEKAPVVSPLQVEAVAPKEDDGAVTTENAPNIHLVSVKSEQDADHDSPFKGESDADKGKSVPSTSSSVDVEQEKKLAPDKASVPSNAKKYHGPLFDLSLYIRKYELLGLTTTINSNSFTLAYDVKELLYEESKEALRKKRNVYLKKLGNLLAFNLERKTIKPDLVLRLQIEEKKLRLLDIQTRLRDEVDEQQQEIMAMPDRPYRKFVRQCERQRLELVRQVQQLQKVKREKQLKAIFQWRKKLLETHWVIRDARTTLNRGVAKYHERMLREFSKRKDVDRSKRFEALKNNDVDRYREMLLEQQTNIPGDAAQRYAVLSSFLSQTEEYLYKLGTKITTSKKQQGVEEAANDAAAAARSQGLSEEEVKAAAACAREEVRIRNTFSEMMNARRDGSSANKYYTLAHAVNEKVLRQPSMLRAGTLRDYQLIGLQWMLSLYNNKLNGILADEMGLGKTVQVMALIAYLMEFKGNYGPHLIIVPNAVLVNWKSELHNWLPSVSCIFYVGSKEERSRLFSHEVSSMKFNVLVTTYEFVMYDRSKLSRIDWKYIIIDEAQRMKDRESVLSRDLDRYRCQRRLLLTGTPLQNDLKELWSLLNLLLPEVFDNRKAFHDWFSKPFQKDGSSHTQEEDDWLETEKKVIVIHRLHQILEPFMLRRRVEDVEGSLPPKVSIVLRCRMSALQGAIYDWIKSTGTIRVDPDDELRRAERNPNYQIKMYRNLNNKCMELRKACNHPLLNYPYFNDYSKEFLIRSCGKLWILDRILLKLHRAGHRVLLFSTMTKLLDLVEEYLQWRRLVYRRIDGTTSLEDRESAIIDFNSPVSDSFIFLLSIRAAGRGLNLQTADTVIIYDPDPNPQNEEQAIARAHRIGQKREVKVIYMVAVVDKISSYQKEDYLRNGGSGDSEERCAGMHQYIGSIESLIRNNIQQYKIEMADEVINAGRFDQRTTHEERRMTLEALLHDEERYQETVYDVPSPLEVNRMIARSEEEVELFDQMDEELDWMGEMTKHDQVPMWLRADSKELNAFIARLYKRPSKNILGSVVDLESSEMIPGSSLCKTERKRGRPRGVIAHKYSSYVEFDDEDGEDFDAGSEEENVYSSREEDRELGYIEDEYLSVAADLEGNIKNSLEEGALVCDGAGYEFSHCIERSKDMCEEADSTGSSFGNRRVQQPVTPSISLRKFGSLSELGARPGVLSTKLNELEEGEIAASSDSRIEIQQYGSWNHYRDDGEDEQVMQPKFKRKRSKRFHPRHTVERLEEKFSTYRTSQHGFQPLSHDHHDNSKVSRIFNGPLSSRHGRSPSSLKQRSYSPTRRAPIINKQKSGGSSYLIGCEEDVLDQSRESWNGQASCNTGPGLIRRKSLNSMQRKCKNVISKLRWMIDKEGCQLVPLFYDLWKKNDSSKPRSNFSKMSSPLNLQSIDQRVESLEYAEVADFIADVQSMLRNVVQFYRHSQEAKYEARKLHDIFFHIMKIAFPDSDFKEVKMALTFSSPAQGRTLAKQSSKPCIINQSKLQKMVREDGGLSPHRSATRTPIFKSNSLLTHPGDLVICKKKRKDRERSSLRPKMGPVRTSLPIEKDYARPTQRKVDRAFYAEQLGGRGSDASSMEELRWAWPVKRMRSDAGRRRPI
ncbi:ATP-dependent helicase BRM-like [Phalaenopsis equestris]|uniref:ATP-dependent helicase BRM-like n=1 Tax=Phalaenopsis equestris TaxID=78828 RepID=UPI0009E1CB96|nr:ATP-dependent helicase BRM-like [Phalaenopsis equestris]